MGGPTGHAESCSEAVAEWLPLHVIRRAAAAMQRYCFDRSHTLSRDARSLVSEPILWPGIMSACGQSSRSSHISSDIASQRFRAAIREYFLGFPDRRYAAGLQHHGKLREPEGIFRIVCHHQNRHASLLM